MSGTQQGPKLAGGDRTGAAQRNRYFRGKLLTVADYTTEQDYQIERRRLINRALHGWGLVSGFAVEAKEGALQISPGLALDRHGRELVACATTILERETDLFWLDADGRPLERAADRPAEPEADWLLSAHYAEKGIDAVRIDDGLGDSLCEANRILETMVFSLARRGDAREDETAAEPDFEPCRTARLAKRSGVEVDLTDPVPLAMVTVTFDRSGDAAFVRTDPAYRPRLLARPAWRVGPEEAARVFETGGGLLNIPRRVPVGPAEPTREGEAT
jgi:hypothetical protein